MADWANLPTDILYLIAKRMEFMEDYISLRFTCKPWQLSTSILLNKKPTLPPRFPRVMLTESAEGNEKKRRFFSQSTSKTYEIELPEATNRKCYGAYYGWLLTVGYDLQINLLHPFTRRQVSVPSLLAFKDQYEYDETFRVDEVVDMFVRKVVISANPENNCQGTDYPYKLIFVDSLGDRALFLGYNASVSMPSSGCVRVNCICFSDDSTELYRCEPGGGGLDTGIFDMERGTVESHYASKFRSLLTPPLWFI